MYIVWNEARTEGFITDDEQLAYEVRKSADSNCVTADGEPAPVAIAFCNRWNQDACTTEAYDSDEVELLRLRRTRLNEKIIERESTIHLLQTQLEARDAALDDVLKLAQQWSGSCECCTGEEFLALLTKHGVHSK